MNTLNMKYAAVAAIALVALMGCEEVAPERTAGQKLDLAIESTRDIVLDTSRKAGEKSDHAVQALKDARDAVGERATDVAVAVDDTAITGSVKAGILKDSSLDVLKIDVETRNGVVILNGLAASEAARERAGKIALATEGVSAVRNYLVVKRT